MGFRCCLLGVFFFAMSKTPYSYQVTWTEPNSHVLHIRMEVESFKTSQIRFYLPCWRPGRYIEQNFAASVFGFQAMDEAGRPLPWKKITKDCWEVQRPRKGKCIVEYNYYASSIDAGSSYIDKDIVYLNPINFLMSVEKDYDRSVKLEFPSLPSSWKVATALRRDGNTFFAESYHEAVDSPFLISPRLIQDRFEVGGLQVYLHFYAPEFNVSEKGLTAFKKKLGAAMGEAIAIFGECPVSEYHFLYFMVPFYRRHAVEHQKSAIFVLPEYHVASDEGLDGLLNISIHEFWHVWNVKAIRPRSLFPYDYSRPMYSGNHWFTEGVTVYYTHLLLTRAGIQKVSDFWKAYSEVFTRLENSYAQTVVSPHQASMDSWLAMTLYPCPYNQISYYDQGFRIGLLLDLFLRKHSQNRVSLDVLFRFLYEKYYKKGPKGYPEADGIRRSCEKLLNQSCDPFFHTFVYKPAPYPYEEVFSGTGVTYSKMEEIRLEGIHWLGVMESEDLNDGILIQLLSPNSPLLSAGCKRGDIIKQVNGKPIHSITQGDVKSWTNQNLEIQYSREGNLKTAIVKSFQPVYYTVYHIEGDGELVKSLFSSRVSKEISIERE